MAKTHNEQPDITVNITAHGEAYYLHKTIKSIEMCCSYIENRLKLRTVIHINLDKADELTLGIARKAADRNPYIKLFYSDFGDAPSSRNYLIAKTTSKYCMFVDGDDLFTENFLHQAYQTARALGKPCVVAAENIIKFGSTIDPIIFKQISTMDRPEIKSAEFETNLYVSQNFVVTDVYKSCRYESNDANYGFEDWHWNTKVINAGYEILVAPDTSFFYRQKPDDKSLLKQHSNSNTVIRRTELFRPDRFRMLPVVEYIPTESDGNSENSVKRHGRRIARLISKDNGIVYRGSRKIYRMTQSTLAPIVHKARNIKNRQMTGVRAIDVSRPPENGLTKYNATTSEIHRWNTLNPIEPLIRFDTSNLAQLQAYYYTFEHSLATSYHWFCEMYGDNKFTDIIFVPWINRGGADQAILDAAQILTNSDRRVLLITTNGVDSQWADNARAIQGLTFVQSHDKIFRYLDHQNIKLLFLRVIQNWDIRTVTVMNSAIGFELINRYGRAIKDAGCKIIAHNYAFPTHDDLLVEAFPSMVSGLEYIDTIVVDSDLHKQEMMEVYGIKDSQIIVVPLVMTEGLREKTSQPTKKILYANRLAREKQPQVAIDTMRLLGADNISMDIFGPKDEAFCDSIAFDKMVAETPNVAYKKSFDGTKQLNFDEYDICFLPSLYEGVPRIVLDSVKANLFIVCTNVGGLPEVVEHMKNGILLSPQAMAKDFAAAIQLYYNTEALQQLPIRKKYNASITSQHSQATYARLIKFVYAIRKGS